MFGVEHWNFCGYLQAAEQEAIRNLLATIEERLATLSDKNYEYTFLVEGDTATEHDEHLTECVNCVRRLGRRARDFMRALKDSSENMGIPVVNQSAGGSRTNAGRQEQATGNHQPTVTHPGLQEQTVDTNTDLQIAIDGMKSIVTEVNVEISFIEHQMLVEGEQLTADHAAQ